MADAEKQALVDSGHRLRIYMPYGELIPGMAYLVRRLLENTSNDSFLRASFTDNVSPEKLLMNPADGKQWPVDSRTAKAGQNADAAEIIPLQSPATTAGLKFRNEPPTDFAIEANRRAMREQLDHVKRQLGQHYKLRIGGQYVGGASKVEARNPAQANQVIGTVAEAGPAHVEQAVAAAKAALREWNAAGVLARAEFLREAAQVMRHRRFELAAWEVLECGKGWREADADVAEAIDFCEYYAAGAVALQGQHGVNVPGEENQFEYLPRGVVAVIAPWNFPLAILTGMTSAALATGNTVVMKPSEQSTVVGAKLMEVFDVAVNKLDIPSGIVNYLPGRGEIVGAKLVEQPDVAVIAFTGSRKVGLEINRRAAEVSAAGISSVKRVIAEMGGKNAIIIDSDADLDEAVLAVVKSAFGYQGQKCSACSRCIVLADVYDQFLTRLVEATRSLKVGLPEDPGTSVGPVIDADSLRRVKEYIEIGRREGREVLSMPVSDLAEQGYFVGPHIFADVPPNSRLAQEEIFGPVLAVIRAADLDEAIRITNGTDYALTGGIFSRSPAHLDRARRELMVGNLYLNRGITGALVGRQPFGGFKMSGIGSKAGGPDYLLQFVLPRTVTENTMRRGFAPPSETQYMGAAEGRGE
jgi:RHH-type proline utilization regulon transcriptional repressor/proline dehydrogenase/delta 1-pyrroline-5-carboxylate dehydrogenase